MAHTFNFVEIIKSNLETMIKQEITNRLIDDLMRQLRLRLKDEIKPLVETITLESVESIRDLQHLRDELKISIKINKTED